jgi:type II secretory pathway pseudopilin PulG
MLGFSCSEECYLFQGGYTMKFSCPNCNLAGSIDDARVPEQGLYADCPKCKTRFLIKKEPTPEPTPSLSQSTQPTDVSSSQAQADKSPASSERVQEEPARPQRAERPASSRGYRPASAVSGNMATFIGKNSDTYLKKFASFNTAGSSSYAVTWHWPAFFVPFWWMVYRKQYLWALLAFVLSCIPTVGFLSRFVFGFTGNYIYYNYANNKLLEINSLPSEMSKSVEMARSGGVNNLVWILAPLIGIAIMGILAAIAIPQFHAYRAKAFNSMAITELRNAKTHVEDYYLTYGVYPGTLEQANYTKVNNVDVRFDNSDKKEYTIISTHQKGDKEFAVTSDSDVLLFRPKSDQGDFVPVTGSDGR